MLLVQKEGILLFVSPILSSDHTGRLQHFRGPGGSTAGVSSVWAGTILTIQKDGRNASRASFEGYYTPLRFHPANTFGIVSNMVEHAVSEGSVRAGLAVVLAAERAKASSRPFWPTCGWPSIQPGRRPHHRLRPCAWPRLRAGAFLVPNLLARLILGVQISRWS